MKQKSIAKNTVIYAIKVISSMLFPLITFPYITRVLGPEGVGKYNFSVSYVAYFSMIAAMGISAYAIREGAKLREEKDTFGEFASEVFTLNWYSTLLAYVLLALTLLFVPKLAGYRWTILILSATVCLTTLGTEWICSVYEDYVYITVRTIAFQILAVGLMFLLVKKPEDVSTYALVTVIAGAGNNLMNFRYVRRYYKHRLVFQKQITRHLKPILILFSSSVASLIYINADTVMLGFMLDDTQVGLYAAATKVYNLVRSVLAAFITVLSPRMVWLYHQEDKLEYKKWTKTFGECFFAIVLAAAAGILFVAKDLIFLLSGEEFVSAYTSLQVLAVALIFSLLGGFVSTEVLLVAKLEKKILLATSLGAFLNIAANFYMIPKYGHFGAAITTLASEIVVFAVQMYYAVKVVRVNGWVGNMIKAIICVVPFYFICSAWQQVQAAFILRFAGEVISCVVAYGVCMVLLKHEMIKMAFDKMRKK